MMYSKMKYSLILALSYITMKILKYAIISYHFFYIIEFVFFCTSFFIDVPTYVELNSR